MTSPLIRRYTHVAVHLGSVEITVRAVKRSMVCTGTAQEVAVETTVAQIWCSVSSATRQLDNVRVQMERGRELGDSV